MRQFFLVAFALSFASGFAQNALPNLRPPYAPQPVDNYFYQQWHLENRDQEGLHVGPDLNVRGAWQATKGEGVIMAIVDDGVELTHRDLAENSVPELHYDFYFGITNGMHRTLADDHGTMTAGTALAALNGIGSVGVAPRTKFASWNVYPTNNPPRRTVIAPDKLASLFAYQNDTVAIQLHNWSETRTLFSLFGQTNIESDAISNAVTLGRGGKGVVMVRPAGNANYDPAADEWDGRNANDDSFASDPRVITVAAARNDGRVTSYSDRGACLLVGGLSGDFDQGYPNIFTTDRAGTNGENYATFPTEPELADYAFGSFGFTGTSASAPEVAGICALILSANPNLTYRDVQQILIHASHHFDKADPDLRRNGAGYWVSHHLGFGIPDAGEAVRLAKTWKNRPPMVRNTYASDVTTPIDIPDASLHVAAHASGTVPFDASFVAFPSVTIQPDDPTPDIPLVDVGLATNVITQDLRGKAALVTRGVNTFTNKLWNVAASGAEFIILANNQDSPPMLFISRIDFLPMPVVFVSKPDGLTLKSNITTQPTLHVQLLDTPAVARFNVPDQMLCEHVGVRVRTTHPLRQDLRITLVSPMGTRSVLQAFNLDTAAGPVDWTYWSTQHFYELSSGLWTLEVVDEVEGSTGTLVGADLIIEGTPITDSDDDGLDDNWEMAKFGTLNYSGLDDPDNDGSWNAREQILGTDPMKDETPLLLMGSNLSTNAVRFAFPSAEGTNYVVRSTTDLNKPFEDVGDVKGDFGETEIISDKTEGQRYFLIRRP